MTPRSSTDPLRPIKVIVLAMAGGVVALSVVALAIARSPSFAGDRNLEPILLAVLGGLVVLEIPAYFFVRQSAIDGLRRQLESTHQDVDAPKLLVGGFTTLTIIAAAMIEGAGLFGAVICLASGSVTAIIAPVLAILGLMLLFPTTDRLRRFEEAVTRRIR